MLDVKFINNINLIKIIWAKKVLSYSTDGDIVDLKGSEFATKGIRAININEVTNAPLTAADSEILMHR